MRSTTAAIATLVAVATVSADVVDLACDPTDCNTGASDSAHSICTSSVIDGNVPAYLYPTASFADAAAVIAYCHGFCDDGSRQGFFDPTVKGAVWDICSGCNSSVVTAVCTICDGRPGVGICRSSIPSPTCNIVVGDPQGDGSAEEVLGQTTTPEECAALVLQHRASADGMAWSTNDGDADGRGNCYAEYNPSAITTDGIGANYRSCIFDPTEETTTQAGLNLEDVTTVPTPVVDTVTTTTEVGDRNGGSGLFASEGGSGDRLDANSAPANSGKSAGKGKKSAGKGKKGKGKGKGKGFSLQWESAGEGTPAAFMATSAAVLVAGVAGFIISRRRRGEDDKLELGADIDAGFPDERLTENTPLMPATQTPIVV